MTSTTTDQTVQFREPPTNRLPGATSTTSPPSYDNIGLQFQEPIAANASSSTSKSINDDDDDTSLHKTTTEKLKDALKKPFSGSENGSSVRMLGNKEIDSPEMAAASEVLAAKDLKSP